MLPALRQAILSRPRFDWIVDSINGNDANSGRMGAPLQTLAALAPKITPGCRIALTRGSTWREKITLSVEGVTIDAYGVGANPTIDCADVVSAGSWTLTAGRTNVYQATLTVDPDPNAVELPALWVNGTRLTKSAVNLTSNEGVAGTFWYGSVEGQSSITIYVHSTGDTDPRSDGKTYEAAVRRAGIDAYGARNCAIRNVTAKRNYGSYGSITLGQYCIAENCTVLEGNAHNMVMRGGASANNCTATDAYADGATFPILFTGYEPTATGFSATLNNCTASCTSISDSTTQVAAFYAHAGTGVWDKITISNMTVTNCYYGLQAANCTTLNINGGTLTQYSQGIKPDALTTNVSGATLGAAQTGGNCVIANSPNITINIDRCSMNPNTTGTIQSTQSGTTINITNCTLTAFNIPYKGAAANQTWNVQNNSFVAGGRETVIAQFTNLTGLTLTSDFNNYNGNTTADFIYGGTTYPDLASWIAGTGQDTHSTP